MENKEQDFINRYKNVQESIVKAMDKALERAIGNKAIDFEKCGGNYLDVYPLIGTVLQKELRSVLGEVDVYYDQISEIVYLAKIILEEMEEKIMGKAVKTDMEYKEILEKSLSAIQYLRIHGFSTYMESEGIVNRIMMFKDKNEMRNRKIKSIL